MICEFVKEKGGGVGQKKDFSFNRNIFIYELFAFVWFDCP